MNHPRRLVRPVVVWHLRDGGDFVEVVRGRRRSSQPLEAFRTPGVGFALLPPAQRDAQVEEAEEEPESQKRGARRGGDVERLEMLRVLIVAPRHSEVAEKE